MPKRIRTFLGVAISQGIRKRLSALEDDLTEAVPGVKWVEPENLHVTLKFLGDVDDHELYAVYKTAQEAVAGLETFEMTVAGIGAFPDLGRPRTIWAGVTQGTPELVAVHAALERAFTAQGYPREDRPYTPHI